MGDDLQDMISEWDANIVQSDKEGNQTAPGILDILDEIQSQIAQVEEELNEIKGSETTSEQSGPAIHEITYNENGEVYITFRFNVDSKG